MNSRALKPNPMRPLRVNQRLTFVASLLVVSLGLHVASLAKAASLQLVTENWGTNGMPTHLSMYVYVPGNVVPNPPVLVLLHYWGGTARSLFAQAQSGGMLG
jgi:hypothetical protein